MNTAVSAAIKQVMVLRKDLNMRKGKMVAQGGHGVQKIFFNPGRMRVEGSQIIITDVTAAEIYWLTEKSRKIALGVDSEAELVAIYNQAVAAGLKAVLIEDAGLTEFHGVITKTAVIIGPHLDQELDPITGHLKPL